MFLKFIFDRGASLFGLIFLFPVLIIVGILICIKRCREDLLFLNKEGLGNMGDCLQCTNSGQ